MKTMNMISRRSFLKAAMAAATVSALGLTGHPALRVLRQHCIQHRFQCSSIFCRRQRGRPDL